MRFRVLHSLTGELLLPGIGAALLITMGSVTWLPRLLAQSPASPPPLVEGLLLYGNHCATCHDQSGSSRAPGVELLRQRTPEMILDALTIGVMASQARALTDPQRRALAVYLSGRPFGASDSGAAAMMTNRCEPASVPNLDGPSWNGWGNGIANTRFQPAPGFTAEQVPTLSLKWAFGLPNAVSAYSQPAVVGGRVYFGSDAGVVYTLDAASGCVYWSFSAKAGVRAAISVGPVTAPGSRYALYFGDIKANVYAVDIESGSELWSASADSHPLARITGAPTLYAGRLYVPVSSLEEAAGGQPHYECCTFRGSLVAFDASTGQQIWKSYTIPREPKGTGKTSIGTQLYGPSGAAIWSAPTIDPIRGMIYVATGDAYSAPETSSDAILAFDLRSGQRRWAKQLTEKDAYLLGCGPTWPDGSAHSVRSETCPDDLGPDFDFGSSPILVKLPGGRTILTAAQKSGIAWALDPDRRGKVLWQNRVGAGGLGGGVVFGPAVDTRQGYFATSDQQLGQGAGGLSAVNLVSGAVAWNARLPCITDRPCQPAQPAAVTATPGVVFAGTLDGMLRAYSSLDGRVVWEFDTAQAFDTVNRVIAKGGSLNGPGPVVADGMLFVTSGYAVTGGDSGNVLLAFAP